MKLCILGSTFAPRTFKKVWLEFGFAIVQKPEDADLVFVSKDTAIEPSGRREQASIARMTREVYERIEVPLILTSQVEPGFTRSLGLPIYHMAETLRIKDALERALNPDYIVLGCPNPQVILPLPIMQFVFPFAEKGIPVIRCTWEEAEFSKIAVNMTLASQVENTNRLASAAKAIGADWRRVAEVLSHDKRIGPYSYLEPGDWKKSQHLLRDYYTLNQING